ncbi:MAG: (2Fe-2S)-binding protein [Pedococcus sp.]
MDESLSALVRVVQPQLLWRLVGADDHSHDLPLVWNELVAAPEKAPGADPTARWRTAFTDATERYYRAPPPPAMPAAFVLQWCLELPATLGATAALLGPWVLDPRAVGLSFAVEPSAAYPTTLQLRSAGALVADPARRLVAAKQAYLDAGRELAEAYRPGVNLGRHQRLAMVDDLWAMAVAKLRRRPPAQRGSCCYLYAVPGTHECAGCPRLRRR